MNTKKTTMSAVPGWFDLKKYADVAQFDIFDWFSNINFRLMLLAAFDGKAREEFRQRLEADGYEVREDREFYVAILEQLLEQPVAKMNQKRTRSMVLGGEEEHNGLVRDLSAMMVMSASEELHKEERYAKAWEAFNWSITTSEKWILERLEGKCDALEDSSSDFMNEKFPSFGNFVFAEVDIHAPFDDLMESFAEWVKNKKSERGIPFHDKKSFSDLDFKRWHKYAVLPYVDLKVWAMSQDVHIPDWLYVEALFGGFQGDTDGMFRKNTKPLEKQVMTQACVDQLRNQGDIHF
jgi:hypothetical protein